MCIGNSTWVGIVDEIVHVEDVLSLTIICPLMPIFQEADYLGFSVKSTPCTIEVQKIQKVLINSSTLDKTDVWNQ